ncbi:DUF5134 domain-containing protein [Mycobacterium sp. 663a-19]|uniref:DUF5134 domain-containing protein n=1 Tax=Mycobacterium sp. 663a-19 TaxID=2986148 RepID=UPI002D1F27DD|nr:DUF5134 domain-containing protein [Mycobacterium sp. 663a-19]MEB3980383.1 DUF5134 domain-containing protein [Mycobacterium sp. 663a-19]
MGDVALRWTVTALFGAGAATYVYILVSQRGHWASTVNHLLHLVMSAAMISMAWGIGMSLPTPGPMIFFLLAGVWFAGAAGRMSTPTGDRLTNGYYAVMMAAMAWMFATMHGGLPSQFGHSSDHAQSAPPAIDMSGMEMPAHEMSPAEPAAHWIAAVNWSAALGFAIVTLLWTCRYFAKRRTIAGPQAAQLAHLEPLYQACTAAGTALMFGALL